MTLNQIKPNQRKKKKTLKSLLNMNINILRFWTYSIEGQILDILTFIKVKLLLGYIPN